MTDVERFVFVIRTRRFAESMSFYRDVIGLSVLEEWNDAGHGATLGAGGPAQVELIDTAAATDVPPGDVTFIGLQVPDIDPIHVRAVASGQAIVREPVERPWGGRGFVVRDPNGVALNVYTAYGTGSTDAAPAAPVEDLNRSR
jgi:predicted enzyme related to lactoylglutathione lyase